MTGWLEDAAQEVQREWDSLPLWLRQAMEEEQDQYAEELRVRVEQVLGGEAVSDIVETIAADLEVLYEECRQVALSYGPNEPGKPREFLLAEARGIKLAMESVRSVAEARRVLVE